MINDHRANCDNFDLKCSHSVFLILANLLIIRAIRNFKILTAARNIHYNAVLMTLDQEPRNVEFERISSELKELSGKFPDAFQKNIYFDEDGTHNPRSALYVAAAGEEHIILRTDGRLLRYTISMGVLNTECYTLKKGGMEEVEDCLKFGQRAISILKARSRIGN